jgi:hypothetical protein
MQLRAVVLVATGLLTHCSGGTVHPPVQDDRDAAQTGDATDAPLGDDSSVSEDAADAAKGDGATDALEDIPVRENCWERVFPGNPLPVDMYLLADNSEDMNCFPGESCPSDAGAPPGARTRWAPIAGAIPNFVAQSAGTSDVAAGLFPRFGAGNDVSCLVADYVSPGLPFGTSRDAFAHFFEGRTPRGAWVLQAALDGALQYARLHAVQQPNRQTIVALVTPGHENKACTDDSFEAASRLAASALAAAPPVKTTVISTLPSLVDLFKVAVAGGTWPQGRPTPTTGDPQTDTVAAIQAAAAPCDYAMPQTSNPEWDRLWFFVRMKLGTAGAFSPLLRLMSPEGCTASGGWFFNDNLNPSRIMLCPSSCRAMSTASGSVVELGIGCPI